MEQKANVQEDVNWQGNMKSKELNTAVNAAKDVDYESDWRKCENRRRRHCRKTTEYRSGLKFIIFVGRE